MNSPRRPNSTNNFYQNGTRDSPSFLRICFGSQISTLRMIILVVIVIISYTIFTILFSNREFGPQATSPMNNNNHIVNAHYYYHENYLIKTLLAKLSMNVLLNYQTPIIPSHFDPFSATSGINIWDIYPPLLSCPDLQRVGNVGEGGKWICGLSEIKSFTNRTCIMYSFGISNDISFEMAILSQTNCIIHAVDPTIGKLPFHNLNPKQYNQTFLESMKHRIQFHKIALNTMSGKTSDHNLNIDLFTMMKTLGHEYIDILKVDIEGYEWSIFKGLYESASKHNNKLPFGQLLIELHYHSINATKSFFDPLIEKYHFLPFSREINLIPVLNNQKPVAVEYSFLNVQNFYHEQATMSLKPMNSLIAKDNPLIQGVIYYLTQHKRLPRLIQSLSLLYHNFLFDYPQYPVYIIHDDLTKEDERTIRKSAPISKLYFLRHELALPSNLQSEASLIPNRTVCDPEHSSLGYRHMCRFHAFGIHELLAKQKIEFDYLWRLDDDSMIFDPIGYDLFEYMNLHNLKYGFINTLYDNPTCVTNLWESVQQTFLGKTNQTTKHIPKKITESQQYLFDHWPQGHVFYNNFEISHSSLWKSSLWKDFQSFIDSTKGIYYLRWGDAPLHTIGVWLQLTRAQIHAFDDISYQHLPFVNQKSKGFNMPLLDAFYKPFVQCNYYEKWQCAYLTSPSSNNTHNITSMNSLHLLNISSSSSSATSSSASSATSSASSANTKDQTKQLQQDVKKYLDFMFSGPMILPNPDETTDLDSTETEDIIERNRWKSQLVPLSNGEYATIFVFGQIGREMLLKRTILNIYEKYARTFHLPFVIFYFEDSNFPLNLFQREIQQSILHYPQSPLHIVFHPIKQHLSSQKPVSSNVSTSDDLCNIRSTEIQSISYFLRYEAHLILSTIYPFTWHIRIGDDASIATSVTDPHPVEDMIATNKKYGYILSMEGRSECIEPILAYAKDICHRFTYLSKPSPHGSKQIKQSNRINYNMMLNETQPCSDSFVKIYHTNDLHKQSQKQTNQFNQIFVTNFEISHSSLWTSSLSQIFLAGSQSASFQFINKHIQELSKSLTLAPLGGKQQGDSWVDSLIHTILVRMNLPEQDIYHVPFDSFQYSFNWHENVTSKIHEPAIEKMFVQYKSKSLLDWDSLFSSSRIGWLGGDVATSIYLPKHTSQQIEKIVWLFGDSILGVASSTQRIQESAFMVPNTIGISSLSDCPTTSNRFQTIDYHWQTTISEDSDLPGPIFTLNNEDHLKFCPSDSSHPMSSTIWPISGLSVLSDSQEPRLIILATVTCKSTTNDLIKSTKPSSSSINNDKTNSSAHFQSIRTLDFQESINILIIVLNPHDLPTLWQYQYIPITKSTKQSLRWVSVTSEKASEGYTLASEYVYILAASTLLPDAQGTNHILLRTQVQHLLTLDVNHHLELLNNENTRGWDVFTVDSSLSSAYIIHQPLISEGSLIYLPQFQEWIIVSLHFLEHYFRICRLSSSQLASSSLFQCEYLAELPKNRQQSQLMNYAAKAHPWLLCQTNTSTSSLADNQQIRLPISFVSNSLYDPSLLFEASYRQVYVPQFIEIAFDSKQSKQSKE